MDKMTLCALLYAVLVNLAGMIIISGTVDRHSRVKALRDHVGLLPLTKR
jgi:hypothetical protein